MDRVVGLEVFSDGLRVYGLLIVASWVVCVAFGEGFGCCLCRFLLLVSNVWKWCLVPFSVSVFCFAFFGAVLVYSALVS